jgi:preprotein translocase YajC subunit
MNYLMNLVYIFQKNLFLKNFFSLFFLLLTSLSFLYFFFFLPKKKIFINHLNLIKSIKKGDYIILENGLIVLVYKIYKNGYIKVHLNKKIGFLIKDDYILNVLPKNFLKII